MPATAIVHQTAGPRSPAIAAKLLLLGCSLLLVMVISGCRSILGDSIVVPEFDTAAEQARNAETQYRRAMQTVDEKTRPDELEKAEAALRKVVTKFPKDRVYTPAAHVLLARTLFEQRKYREAEATYREVISQYPDIDDVHATALFGLGSTLDEMKRFREAKDYYRQLIEAYTGTQNRQIQDQLVVARARYRSIPKS